MSAWNKPRADMTPDEVRQARAYVRRRETEAQCRNCRHIKKSHGASGCFTQDGDECGCRTWYGAQSRADAGGADVSEKAQEMFEWLDRRFGNECGHNHARDNDKPPLPQGARPDTYKYLDAELSAAEERGRRSAETERDELRAIVRELRPLVHETFLDSGPMEERAWERFLARIDAAIAPRVPHASEGPPCAGCGHPKWQHQYGSKEHAFCCAPLDELQRDYCRCKNYLAPRDSAPSSDYPGCSDPAHDCRDGTCGMGPARKDRK